MESRCGITALSNFSSFFSGILRIQALSSAESKVHDKLSVLFLIVAVIATSQIIIYVYESFDIFLHSFLINCQEMIEFLGS